MNDRSNRNNHLEHGAQCSCTLLAQAVGLDPRKLSFAYCHNVLQKHWRMTCRHGQRASAPVATGLSEHWRDLGPVDPVKAILISNDQRDQ